MYNELVASDPLAVENRVMSAACLSVACVPIFPSSGTSHVFFACNQLSQSVIHMLMCIELSPQECNVLSALYGLGLNPHTDSKR